MAVRIRLRDPALLDELVTALRAGECTCEREGEDVCLVSAVPGADDRQRQLELVFFLRAWALRHGGLDSILTQSESLVQA